MLLTPILLAILAATPQPPAGGVIEAAIRGTAQPLEVELLRAEEHDAWTEVAHQSLGSATRRVRFDGLGSGVYQLRVRGPAETEVHATKIAVGAADTRRVTIAIEPAELSGRVTFGGTPAGAGGMFLQHESFGWRVPVTIGADGTFRAPLWQRGRFRYSIRLAAMATSFTSEAELDGASPLVVDIPDGRIRGIVRDGASGAPLDGATVTLASNAGGRERHVRTKTGADGRFDFTGIEDGTHTLRVYPPAHLEPAPRTLVVDRAKRLHELDLRVDAGRAVPVLVIDANDDPVGEAHVLAVVEGKVRARSRTDEDGRASVAVPEGETATLFVVPAEGGFGVQRVPPGRQRERVRVYLAPAASSLLIRARTTDGREMPPFSLLMRYNGALMPAEIAEELDQVQGLKLATGGAGDALLERIPAGSYEFWPYRTDEEAEAIAASASVAAAPIVVNVRTGENKIAVKFARR